ncbi:MAG: hypothetical protein ACLUVC_08010 [Longibaculum sp.]
MLNYTELQTVYTQVESIIAKKLWKEMILANRTDGIDKYLEQFDIASLTSERARDKLLILGYSNINKDDIYDLCLKYGYTSVEIISDKNKIKRFDCNKLKNNTYAAVIVGQLPHKMLNLEGRENNLLREIRENKNMYPNVYPALRHDDVRITLSSIESVLEDIKYTKLS